MVCGLIAGIRRSCRLTDRGPVSDKREMSTQSSEILRLAQACAERLRAATGADAALLEPLFRDLLTEVQRSDDRFAFDLDGRPGAIAAVREALPPAECELLDAILEDHACELAAVREAMFQVARAAAAG